MLKIFIDADASPIKEEVYRVAARYKLKVFVVGNRAIKIPLDPNIEMIVVKGNLDAADDWIVENIDKDDIATTADILLADRLIKKGARVLGHKGDEFTEDNIGEAVASREILAHLRELGQIGGGQAPMEKRHKSLFLSSLDRIIQSIIRKAAK